CADACNALDDCAAPAVCAGGSCGKIANGLPCRNTNQCQSGFCVDGLCCNAACTQQCMACDVSGALGTCAQVPAGNPHGGRPARAAYAPRAAWATSTAPRA